MRIRSLLRVLAVSGVLVAVLAAGAWLWLRGSGRPARTGEHRLPGLAAPVEVRWDRWGVPHVRASSEEDLASAQGYLHANDRLVQMEIGRRAAFGRLAEVFGRDLLEADIYFRTLRLGAAADAMMRDLAPRSRLWLEAYGRGVDAWLAERGADLPTELRLLRIRPEPWRPRDSMAFALLMAHNLSFWDDRPEEERLHWLGAFGATGLSDLTGETEPHLPPGIEALARSLRPGPGGNGSGGGSSGGGSPSPGSNSWAVAPSRTAGGRALLANDPHLGLGLPAVWYQMLLRAPGYEAAGMSLPGAPGIVIGRGPHMAWAFTNTMLDDHDLFLEEIDERAGTYRRGERWLPLEVEEHTIRVRGGEAHPLLLRSTDRGPLLEAEEERALPPRSLAWTAYLGGDPLGTLRHLSQAADPEEALAGLDGYLCPAQNLVAAFASGEILFTVIGRVPERRRGDGLLPAPGGEAAYGWQGLRPRRENPTVFAPGAGLLATANTDHRPAGYPHPLPADYDTDHRWRRIVERLEEGQTWSVESVAELQTDVTSLYAREVVSALDGSFEGAAARALAALRVWDGGMRRRGPAALFALLERRLLEGVFGDEAEAAGLKPIGSRARLLRALGGGMQRDWWDDVSTPGRESRPEVLGRALERAWRETLERWGPEPEDWDYGALHTLTLRHPLEGVPLLGAWLRRGPFEVPGSAATVAAFGATWRGEAQEVVYGPSMRWLVDWSRPDRVFAALPGGQSGHGAEAHYDDRIAPYLAGELQEGAWSEEAVAAATVSRMRLLPAAGAEESP